jgi:hypothetical protein
VLLADYGRGATKPVADSETGKVGQEISRHPRGSFGFPVFLMTDARLLQDTITLSQLTMTGTYGRLEKMEAANSVTIRPPIEASRFES